MKRYGALLTLTTVVLAAVAPPALSQTMRWQDYDQPGYQHTQQAIYSAAELALTNRLEQLNATAQPSDETVLSYLQKLVAVCANQGKFQDAQDYCRLAIRFSERGSKHEERTAMLYVALGNCAFKLHKLTEAELDYKKAQELLSKAPQAGPLQRARLLSGQAEIATANGKLDEAANLFKSALELEKSAPAGVSPAELTRYAKCLQMQGQIAEAKALLKQALKLDRDQLGEGHPALAANLNNLALLDARSENLAAAETEMAQALAIGRQWKYTDLPDWIDNMAYVLEQSAKHDEAAELRRESMAMRDKRIPKVFSGPTPEPNAAPGISERAGSAGVLRAF